jgi:hypothetical protein
MMPLSLHNQKMGDGCYLHLCRRHQTAGAGFFAVLLDAYGIIPDPLIMPVAMVLPALEVTAGAGLLFDLRGSLSFITGLLVLFSVITSYGIGMGLDVECGCFGRKTQKLMRFTALKRRYCGDLMMLAAALFLFGWRRYRNIEPRRLNHIVDSFHPKRSKKDAYI